MGIHTKEIQELIIKYFKERYGKDVTVDKLHEYEWYRQVGWHKDALAYFKMKNFYFSFEDVTDPMEGMRVFLRKKGTTEEWRYVKGKWKFWQEDKDVWYK